MLPKKGGGIERGGTFPNVFPTGILLLNDGGLRLLPAVPLFSRSFLAYCCKFVDFETVLTFGGVLLCELLFDYSRGTFFTVARVLYIYEGSRSPVLYKLSTRMRWGGGSVFSTEHYAAQ